MKYSDLLEETIFAVTANKARSSLTILGIVIGIASVIAMISVGQGAQSSVEANIQSIGSNLIMVQPGFVRGVGQQISAGRGSASTLTQEDADAIAQEINGIKAVAPEKSSRFQVTAKGTNTNTQVIGTTADYAEVRNVSVEKGNFILDSQVKNASKVAVLGPTTAEDLFGEGVDPTGQGIKINRVEFKVIGVTKAKGGSGFSSQDDIIYVPLTAAQRFLSGDESLSSISVQAENPQIMSTVQQQITNLLLQRHSIANAQMADFQVLNQSDIVVAASSVTDTFTILLASIAGISLLVGGIGIMNMMLTTVTERTREIGLRKAIGGTRHDITLQFLAEAVTLTFLGGVFGIILGWILAFGISYFGDTSTRVSLFAILLAFGVSAGIGVIFGYYPARRAAKLNPIDALRYE